MGLLRGLFGLFLGGRLHHGGRSVWRRPTHRPIHFRQMKVLAGKNGLSNIDNRIIEYRYETWKVKTDAKEPVICLTRRVRDSAPLDRAELAVRRVPARLADLFIHQRALPHAGAEACVAGRKPCAGRGSPNNRRARPRRGAAQPGDAQAAGSDGAHGARRRPIRRLERLPIAGDRLDLARTADHRTGGLGSGQGGFDPGAPSAPERRFLSGGLARRHHDFRPRSRLRGRNADARRSRRYDLMAIIVKLDELLHERRMSLTELSERIDITLANLSILKTGKARAIRFSTLEAICIALACQPGDLLEFNPDTDAAEHPRAA